MTAPANTLLTAAAAQRPRREAAPAAAAPGARHGETPGFAAHLAREVPSAAEANAARLPPSAPTPAKPGRLAHTRPSAATPDEATPEPSAETGKTTPATRQKPAATLAAFALAATQVLQGAPARADGPTEPSAKTAADTPDAEAAALVLLLPGGAPLLPPATAPAAPSAARSQPQPADAAPVAAPLATPITAPINSGAAQMAHPAAFAAANLVLEHDAAPPTPESAPGSAAPDSTVQTAARAQPSTFAALTGAPEPERQAARKLRTEIETTRAAPLPAPDIAGGLVLAQQTPAQPAFAPGPEAAAAGPQPLSFDQLVDSIARARDGADQVGPVAVALRHAEFGRISLRIESDGTGLAVAMTSPDPTFAPAVAAAHAAAASIEAARTPQVTHAAESSGAATRDSAQDHASGHSGQRHEAPRAPQRSAPRGEASAAPARRNGIFA